MSYWPARGSSGAALHQALGRVHNGAQNIFAGGHETADVIANYLKWCTESTRMLELLLRPADLRALVLTDTYWAAQANPAPSKHLLGMINNEVAIRQRLLEQAVKDLQAEIDIWSVDVSPAVTAFVVADTNVLLHHPQPLDQLDWHQLLRPSVSPAATVRVVIPLAVVDELDDAKRDKVRARARDTLKVLYSVFGDNVAGPRLMHPAPPAGPSERIRGGVEIQLLMDPTAHTRMARTDDELVERTAALGSFRGHPIEFVTYDTGAAFRARAAGLRSRRLDSPDPPTKAPRTL